MARSMNINHRGDVTMNMVVDADDLKKIAEVLRQVAHDQKQRVLASALNRTAEASRTVIKNYVYEKGGIKKAAIGRNMKSQRANSQNLVFTLDGYGVGLKVTAGKGAKNGNFRSVKWNRKWSGSKWSGPEQTKAHSFMVKPEGRNTFKKHGGRLTQGVVMTRKNRSRLPLQVEFDDGVGKLMLQSNPVRIANEKMRTVFARRVTHEAEKGLLYGKRKYGL